MPLDTTSYFSAIKSGDFNAATLSVVKANPFYADGIKGNIHQGIRLMSINNEPLLRVIYEHFDAAMKEAQAKISTKDFCEDELRTATRTFVRWAVTKTPPNPGNMKLYSSQDDFEKLYYRPILYLPALLEGKIRGFHVQSGDADALKAGFRFKVVDTKGREKKARCYTKTKIEALEQARIIYRGLTRAAWGLNLHQIGVKDPVEVTRLLQESPSISEQGGLNNVFYANQGVRKYVELHNRADGVSISYKQQIAASALKYADRYLRSAARGRASRVLNDAVKEHRKSINEALNDKLKNDDFMSRFIGGHQIATGEQMSSSEVQGMFFNYLDSSQNTSFFRSYNNLHEGNVQDRFTLDLSNNRFNFNLR